MNEKYKCLFKVTHKMILTHQMMVKLIRHLIRQENQKQTNFILATQANLTPFPFNYFALKKNMIRGNLDVQEFSF
jgi:hypothetical protein